MSVNSSSIQSFSIHSQEVSLEPLCSQLLPYCNDKLVLILSTTVKSIIFAVLNFGTGLLNYPRVSPLLAELITVMIIILTVILLTRNSFN